MSQLALSLLRAQVVAVVQVLALAQISGGLTDFRVELHVHVLLLADENGVLERRVREYKDESRHSLVTCNLEMEVDENDHLGVARLEEGVLDVVVEDVHLVATHRLEAEAYKHQQLSNHKSSTHILFALQSSPLVCASR